MKQTLLFFLFLHFGTGPIVAQKSVSTFKINQEIKIDGIADESEWSKAEIAGDFVTRQPVFGDVSRFKSEVKVLYNNEAIFVSANLIDSAPDSVSYTLSQRDDFGNADWFAISFDPFGNYVNAFRFGVTAAGVEYDALMFNSSFSDNGGDRSWNAVWKSTTIKTATGWSCEMRIPFSAIRFPNKDIQNWNINMTRSVRRVREESYWNPVDPNVFGTITQAGKLSGVSDIKPPIRLAFIPYMSTYLENSYDTELGKQTIKTRFAGGMDIKYGLNESFTLDLTLIPDFGQTTSDKQVLNLGPFEVQFNENRPFFIEGTNLFKIGNVFYSRRVGGTPYNSGRAFENLDEDIGERVISQQTLAPVINAVKVSGRTTKGLGIGVFNALEGISKATIEDDNGNRRNVETNPLTNYNVLVLSQNLKNNSTISFVNTNVMRDGKSHDANVSVGEANIYSKDGGYRISNTVKLSSIFDEIQTNGHAFSSSISKVSGVWQYAVGYSEESDTYNPNDLGFLTNNNSRKYNASLKWNDYTPTKYFFNRRVQLRWDYSELYKPQIYSSTSVGLELSGKLKSQTYTRFKGTIYPLGHNNHFESRTFGKLIKNPPGASADYFFTTDYSKRFALDGKFEYYQYLGQRRKGTRIWLSPRLRISERWNLILEAALRNLTQDFGYISPYGEDYDDDIILGVRDRVIVENTIKTEFIFTKRMGLDLRLRHYWQQVNYTSFRKLLNDGSLTESDYGSDDPEGNSVHNTNYNAFTLDVNYRWVFFPGSELRIVYKNNIFHSKNELENIYFDTFSTLFDQPQINSVSVKLLMFVDAIYFRRKNKAQKKELN